MIPPAYAADTGRAGQQMKRGFNRVPDTVGGIRSFLVKGQPIPNMVQVGFDLGVKVQPLHAARLRRTAGRGACCSRRRVVKKFFGIGLKAPCLRRRTNSSSTPLGSIWSISI